MFLSTTEPTTENGDPSDPVRSLSNEQVFNTIMTRARSLIYCVGNPFALCQIGDKYPAGVNCWKAYLQRCVQCETLQFTLQRERATTASTEAAAQEIQRLVFPHKTIDEAAAVQIPNGADKIISQYIRELNQRRDYRIGTKLVHKPEEDYIDWIEDEESVDESIVPCKLEYLFFNKARAIPLDKSRPPFQIQGQDNLRGSLHGDIVMVDTETNCVLFDKETEQAISQRHFGNSFLCRVSERNCI